MEGQSGPGNSRSGPLPSLAQGPWETVILEQHGHDFCDVGRALSSPRKKIPQKSSTLRQFRTNITKIVSVLLQNHSSPKEPARAWEGLSGAPAPSLHILQGMAGEQVEACKKRQKTAEI